MIKNAGKLLTLMLILALIAVIIPVHHPVLATDAAQWTPANIPTEGITGKWTLANGSDIRYLTMANDGTLYCYANPTGTTYTLFKSTDSGRSWTTTGKVSDVIVDIAISPQDNANIYYATASRVYKSVDAGNTFTPLPPNPGGAGSWNVSITSIDVVYSGNANTAVVSTIDTDAAQYGGVYLLDESQSGSVWVNTNIGNYDVCRVAFSPNYNNDHQIIAVASDETNICISSKIVNSNWGQTIGNARVNAIVPSAASIAFPDNYNGTINNATYFVGLDTGINGGDVYQINSAAAPAPSITKDLKIGSMNGQRAVDVASLAISGSTLLAGCARNAWVYSSNDGGVSWTQNSKPPTGQTDTCLLISPDFTGQHKIYAVTRGTESAFSYSGDGGMTWNQISLIDTKISDIPDIATPLTATIFMLTFNSSDQKHSLWRTTDSGITWDRIFCSSFNGIDNFNLIKVIPQYSSDSPIIFIAGQVNNNPVIWKSNDNGHNFAGRIAPCAVDTLSIVDSNTWFVGGYDGSKGLIYQTTNEGNSYSTPAQAGSQALAVIAVSPNYLQDKTILAGNSSGQVFLSQDNGTNYSLLGQALPLTAGVGKISVAFDCKFSENRIIYAATDAKVISTSKDRIFRFTIGQSTTWKSIYSSLPDAAIIKQVAMTNDGTLYAMNNESTVAADTKGGVVRSLNPTYSAPTFETMLSGFDDAATLNKMSLYGNQLWVVDSKNMHLMTFIDNLTLPMTLVSPDSKAAGLDTANLNLKWEAVSGAIGYEWQVSDNAGFSGLLTALTGNSDSSSARVTGLTPATTYYWRVRTNNPYLSRWSDTWTFNTMLGGTNVVPVLSVPAAGAKTTVKPIFQWSTINTATKYDLMVATDSVFSNIVIDKTGDNAVDSNAWESDIELENNTTFYWKVKARSDKSFGAWSAVGAFITEPAPVILITTEEATSTTDSPLTTTSAPIETIISTLPPLITTSTLIIQLTDTTQPVDVNVSLPQWIIYGGITLLGIIVITLAALVVTTIRRRH
jgi:photosystem II stability/assembly factor-like uncharacterized protein